MNTDINYKELLKKYDVPTPRYTSYPTVPYWDENTFSEKKWLDLLADTFKINNQKEGLSLYIHLPFCEKLCTYCGCNKRITVNHKVEEPYIEALLKEWDMYLSLFSEPPIINEIHLGGGTPTFFAPEMLQKLIERILSKAIKGKDFEFSVEVHPNYTTKEHLSTLFNLGFTRLSAGVQDFDPKVQFLINRIQTFAKTKEVIDAAREIGYTSINTDIIYGLPAQTLESVELTVNNVKKLRPERIAFYSYAHVPWKSKSQRRYSEEDLPSAEKKRELYEKGREMLLEAGYVELGMDHFTLPSDNLFKALEAKTLHRNFMGYTIQKSKMLIGLGASSIGDIWGAFMQNVKDVDEYEQIVMSGQFPIFKGHILDEEDLFFRKHILNLMCNLETEFTEEERTLPAVIDGFIRLKEFENDSLIDIDSNKVLVTELGKAFIRNICSCFDARLYSKNQEKQLFSKSI